MHDASLHHTTGIIIEKFMMHFPTATSTFYYELET